MLDFVYYPVSAVLWFWHRVFGFVLGPDNGVAWALAVVFLVFTLRTLLIKPFVGQIRSQLAMKKLQPRLEEVRKKYSGDRARQATEIRTVQKEHGVNPLMGCLPLLAQAPVFIGLLHVLRSFNRTGTGFGHLGMSAQENASTANYVFGAGDVQSFLDARLFGAPISAAVSSSRDVLEAFGPFGGVPSVWSIAVVAVPLMIVAAVATHLNSRASIARQDAAAAANPQTAIMNKLALWVFPAGVLIGGPVLPVAVLLYWVSNNIWTYAQQHIVYRRIDREPVAVPSMTSAVTAPKPRAKPKRR
ncbi:MAG: membrane protein insertase YidC [Rhodococcus sp.]|jgi:YidC/Oxa1 family membrane protein insertase|uniref:membrane protein insertase YidC n=1 Tax=Nocardiaceae TaxID=85025 RepID=UPI00061EAF7F|nr:MULTISPECIES: membrane protein insertase YidC [Rhodococcus]KJV00017.1 putative OxaA family protein [Rhodococcus sp. PML026]MBJ7323942.1 membrane protein insertase YidC [Rhodococcus sp. (in: high G+C Gram-positive bacteria)]MCX6492895.1 membrane protein insertase YidC [Rhodococcus sp. (in: high G+C Gram-positive bacteria)]MDJ0003835.1 membrane protein insertase YidC [Rhodococcus fascians]MDJ0427065.1 membrane protein insertase YidC [Rhodococcus fascians]